MKKFVCVVAAVSSLLGAVGVTAKGVTNAQKQVLALSSINGSPLRINVGDDNSFQVFNTTIGGGNIGQIYPSTSNTLADMGWFVSVEGDLTAPDFDNHGTTATGGLGAYTAFSNSAVSPVTGAGTAASPFRVTVSGTTNTGLASLQTVTYINGENFFRKTFRVSNPGTTGVNAKIFLAADIYLASSDRGTPFQEETSGAPGGQTCAGVTPVFTILLISQGPIETGFTADGFSSVWQQIASGALNNTVNEAECIDNGAGLQWDVSVPANSNVTIQAVTSFGDIPGSVIGLGEPIWNYTVLDGPTISPEAVQCVRNKFPANRFTNRAGWAPSEGDFYHEQPGNPGFIVPPNGLALAILECFVTAWNDMNQVLNYPYCWAGATPGYSGLYPDQRQAEFSIYPRTGDVCDGPVPGTSVFSSYVSLQRRLFYPPRPPEALPLLQDGFEF